MMLHLQDNSSDIIYIMIDSFVSLKFVCFVGAYKKLQRGGGGQSQQHPESRSFFATFQTNITVRLVREPKGILRYCAETHHMTSYLFLNGTLHMWAPMVAL